MPKMPPGDFEEINNILENKVSYEEIADNKMRHF